MQLRSYPSPTSPCCDGAHTRPSFRHEARALDIPIGTVRRPAFNLETYTLVGANLGIELQAQPDVRQDTVLEPAGNESVNPRRGGLSRSPASSSGAS
jgi:hypothetical protein